MKLGRYEVVRDLKAGGMAAAILARAPDGRQVVLKRPLENDRLLFARLRDEARVGARVSHPNLVETLDIFEHEGRPVLVVGYVRGVSIHELRRGAPVTTAGVARIGWQMASCLHALHEAADESGKPFHVVHRDVSGGNILVDVGGDAHLIDLGIAKFDEGRSAHTATGQLIGTVRYMAPEILDEHVAAPASDLWALACVLVEAATGEPVFAGTTREVLSRIGKFQSADELGLERVDPRLRAVLADVLRADPKARLSAPQIESRLRALEKECGGGAQDLADLVAKQASVQIAAARKAAIEASETDGGTEPTDDVRTRPEGSPLLSRTRTVAPSARAPEATARRRARLVASVSVVLALALVSAFVVVKRAGRARAERRAHAAELARASAAKDDGGQAARDDGGQAVAVAPAAAPSPPPALRALDGCGAPPRVEPFFDNGDGTFQSEAGFGSSSIIKLKFACPVSSVRVTVLDAHGHDHRVEGYDKSGKLVAIQQFDAAPSGTRTSPRELTLEAAGALASVHLVPARGDHVWYSLTTAPLLTEPPLVAPMPEPGEPHPGEPHPGEPPPYGARLSPAVKAEVERALGVMASCDRQCAVTIRAAIDRGARPPPRALTECADACEADR